MEAVSLPVSGSVRFEGLPATVRSVFPLSESLTSAILFNHSLALLFNFLNFPKNP